MQIQRGGCIHWHRASYPRIPRGTSCHTAPKSMNYAAMHTMLHFTKVLSYTMPEIVGGIEVALQHMTCIHGLRLVVGQGRYGAYA